MTDERRLRLLRLPARALWSCEGDTTFSPPLPCDARGCALTVLTDGTGHWLHVQHGDNPEAVYAIPHAELATGRSGYFQDLRERLAAWVEQVHAYEDGAR